MTLDVTITTPEGLAYKGEALKVVVPAHDGELGILPRHAPLIGMLGIGELRVSPVHAPAGLSFFVSGGFVQVLRNRVSVLATRAEPASAIDPSRAEEEVRSLLAEGSPAGAGAEVRTARAEKLRAAKARSKIASRGRPAK